MGPSLELTVACVLRSGGQYGPEHVRGLKAQADHWLPDARFMCLSDIEVPCERVPMETDWPGWWAKIELFRHFKGRTLYLDLDTVIVKDPRPLVTDDFLMIQNWVYPELLASGVMSWNGDYSHIADRFDGVKDDVMQRYVTKEQWGDQAFIAENAGNVKPFPWGEIASYKIQRPMHNPPGMARIVAFNGTHVPWNGPRWARQWWSHLSAS